jgi:hypothetical protein
MRLSTKIPPAGQLQHAGAMQLGQGIGVEAALALQLGVVLARQRGGEYSGSDEFGPRGLLITKRHCGSNPRRERWAR